MIYVKKFKNINKKNKLKTYLFLTFLISVLLLFIGIRYNHEIARFLSVKNSESVYIISDDLKLAIKYVLIYISINIGITCQIIYANISKK